MPPPKTEDLQAAIIAATSAIMAVGRQVTQLKTAVSKHISEEDHQKLQERQEDVFKALDALIATLKAMVGEHHG